MPGTLTADLLISVDGWAGSDGLPGYVISVDHTSGQTKELLTCGQATRAGAACTLPTNVAAK